MNNVNVAQSLDGMAQIIDLQWRDMMEIIAAVDALFEIAVVEQPYPDLYPQNILFTIQKGGKGLVELLWDVKTRSDKMKGRYHD